ncbi:hypothetical protein BCR36DRAFT_319420 [Piromyces finnis]|uniref:BRISC and BRCA1-A complex member 2 n=1 Tax=Piromyces finnis TaxID=1754191 RepID=A0A1Y1VJ67_9FUNG|nr:hypothetical protein BCR36DRAFT_319420 [Piromyces finnis]|eukprot:ORX57219.1 hypothetical protein BCR36DRAFT_319420 [Piromyces finnis]
MASPLVTDLKSVISLQTYLNIALKKLLESDKYQILKVTDQRSSRIDLEDEQYDIFTLVYTILDITFKITLLFDNKHPLLPPDIILEDTIGFDKECEKENILSLNSIIFQWNIKDENCLIILMNNLKKLFKEYQLNKAIKLNIPRINFELSTLMSVCNNFNIMMIPHEVSVYEKIKVIIPLEKKSNNNNLISFDDTNDYIYGVLLISEFLVDKSSNEVVSNSIDYIFSRKTKLIKRINKKMPKWEINISLHDYMKETEMKLDDIILLKTNDNIRREFVTAIISEFNEYLLEYDPLDFSYASFYIKHPKDGADLQANSIVLFFYVGDEFPQRDPVVTIIVPYHQVNPDRSTRHDIKYHFNKKYFTENPKRYQEAASLFKKYIINNITQFIREYKN